MKRYRAHKNASLLKLLRKEREILGYLQDLGLTAPQAIEFLTHDVLISSQAGSPVTEGLFDASDRKEGGETVVWWNDIEKDSRLVSMLYVILITSKYAFILATPVGPPNLKT